MLAQAIDQGKRPEYRFERVHPALRGRGRMGGFSGKAEFDQPAGRCTGQAWTPGVGSDDKHRRIQVIEQTVVKKDRLATSAANVRL